MPYFIDNVDDPLITDGNPSFAGGMSLLQDPELLDKNQYADAVNLQLDRSGRIQTRRGCVSLGQPGTSNFQHLSYFEDGTNEHLITAVDGVIYDYQGSSWTSVPSYTPVAANMVEAAVLVNRIYLTDGSGNVHQWDGTTMTDLGTGGGNPPICKYLISHSGRVFGAGVTSGLSDEVRVSSVLDASASNWNAVSGSIRVGRGDQDPITGIASWHNYFVAVFTRSGSWVINADPTTASPSDWSIQTVNNRVGCVSHRSITAVGNDLFFLSDDGVRTLNRVSHETQIGVTNPISESIRPLIERINWSYAHKSSGVFRDNYYFLSVPLDSSTDPNYILAYHTLSGQWTGYWTGLDVSQFAISKMGGVEKLILGRSDGYVWESRGHIADNSTVDTDYQDAGADIPSELTSRAYTFGDPISGKQGFNWELEFYKSKSALRVDVITDDGAPIISFQGLSRNPGITMPTTLPATVPVTGTYQIARNMNQFGGFRRCQLKVSSPAGKMSLQRLKLTGFLNTLRTEKN